MSLGSTPHSHPSSIVVLGADAVLAALPATPVQLAHACRALGYDVAFPASWGDEVVARACLEELADFQGGPAILCSCPRVTERLTRSGSELASSMINLAAPPVAAARYLRALYGERPVQITYAGSCPSATDPAIDVRISPAELFAAFAEQGIVPASQPELFDSVLPPDRRRFHSVPGGAPSAERLAEMDQGRGEKGGGRTLAELEGGDDDLALDLAQRLIAGQRELIDLAPRLGCACSGVLVAGASSGARDALVALEPPRASAPVLDPAIRVEVTLPFPAVPGDAQRDMVAAADPQPTVDPATHPASSATAVPVPVSPPTPASAPAAPTRRRPAIALRRGAGRAPALVRGDGVVVPRAYAARSVRKSGAPPVYADRAPDREEWGMIQPARLADGLGTRRPKRVTRPVVIPLSTEPPRSVPLPPPPAPAKHRPAADVEIGAVAGDG